MTHLVSKYDLKLKKEKFRTDFTYVPDLVMIIGFLTGFVK